MAYTAGDLEALRAARSAKMERNMATSPILAVPPKQLEDPLAHLPCSSILEYRKGQVIYNQDQPSTSIYLVIDGKVKVCRMADDGRQVVVDIYQTDEFFGRSRSVRLCCMRMQVDQMSPNSSIFAQMRSALSIGVSRDESTRTSGFNGGS